MDNVSWMYLGSLIRGGSHLLVPLGCSRLMCHSSGAPLRCKSRVISIRRQWTVFQSLITAGAAVLAQCCSSSPGSCCLGRGGAGPATTNFVESSILAVAHDRMARREAIAYIKSI